MGIGLTRRQLQRALQELADQSMASCENYPALLRVIQFPHKQPSNTPSQFERTLRSRPKLAKGRRTRSAIRKTVQDQTVMQDGRWYLMTSFAIMGKSLSQSERATAQARLLLQRYGILVKEFYRRERGLLTWYKIFQALKRLEWQGEIRRGYFVNGLSGVQFALPEALDLLEKIHNDPVLSDNLPVLLSSMDPALPYGGSVGWEVFETNHTPLKIVRSPANHLAFVNGQPVLYGENFFNRLSIRADLSKDDFVNIAQFFKDWLKLPSTLRPRTHLEIIQINGTAAAQSKYTEPLLRIGFEKDGDHLLLWPSAV
jgi:ATP-dependent Lhr-like helicase